MPAETKRITPGELAALANGSRAGGARLIVTPGAFDLPHVGHLHLLAQARSTADIVAVLVFSDDSIRSEKGAGRPVMNSDQRARVLAGLSYVDFVSVIDPARLEDLLLELRPDVVLVGAADKDSRTVRAAESAGVRVGFVDELPGRSTTTIIEKIRASA